LKKFKSRGGITLVNTYERKDRWKRGGLKRQRSPWQVTTPKKERNSPHQARKKVGWWKGKDQTKGKNKEKLENKTHLGVGRHSYLPLQVVKA